MGKDKGSLIINGKPMILHILDTLNCEIDELIIVLNDKERIIEYEKFIDKKSYSYSIKIIEDEIKNKGPISGIMTGLKKINTNYALILPCDSPNISKNFINLIFKKLKNFNKDGLILYHLDEKIEPLHSVYSKNTYKIIEKLIKNNKLDVKSLINELNCEFIKIDNKNIKKRDTENINTKKDIENLFY